MPKSYDFKHLVFAFDGMPMPSHTRGMRHSAPKVTVPHRHAWLWEPLAERLDFFLRPMFGSQAVYLDGKIIAGFFTKSEPWRGVLFATSREHHESLRAQFPELKPHKVLGKWLYLSEANAGFERVAPQVLRLALTGDPRIGVVPQPKKPRLSAPARRDRAGASAGRKAQAGARPARKTQVIGSRR